MYGIGGSGFSYLGQTIVIRMESETIEWGGGSKCAKRDRDQTERTESTESKLSDTRTARAAHRDAAVDGLNTASGSRWDGLN